MPDGPRPGCAMVIAAHADDVDFRCAGTLAKWVACGTAVTLVVLTDSAKGSHDLSLDDCEVAAIREAEQRRAAAAIGYDDVRVLSEEDGRLRSTESLIQQLVRLVREVRPEVILSYDPWAPYILHPDHTAAGQVAFAAAIRAREPRFYREFARAGLESWNVSELWLFAPFEPNHVEDVAEFFEAKLTAILSHESQYPTEMGFEPTDSSGRAAFIERMRAMFAGIGELAGYRYGESFRRIEL